MFLKELTNKEILSGKSVKGVCRGVGISLKSHAVKYLLCADTPTADVQFSVSVSAVENVDEQIRLSSLRPLMPSRCIHLCIGRPVYSFEGAYLGRVSDLAMQDFTATYLFTDKNAVYPITSVTACRDAVLLKKESPFPIGQRIPAPFLYLTSDKKDGVITKPILRAAIAKSNLVKLTLALPPFHLEV